MRPPAIRAIRFAILGALFLATGLLGASCAIAWHYSTALLHPPRPTLAFATTLERRFHDDRLRTPADLALPFREIEYPGGGGLTVRGWYVPGTEGDTRVVVFAHGNGSNRRHGLPYLDGLHRRGFHVLLIDFTGRGDSDGDTVTYGARESEDLIRARSFAATLPGLASARVALWGHSMGAAASILAAGRDPGFAAVVADSPYANLGDAIRDGGARLGLPRFPLLPELRLFIELRGGFDFEHVAPEEAARKLRCPLLLLHGLEDRDIGPSHSQRILAAAAGPKEYVPLPGLRHNDPRPPEIVDRVLDFLEKAMPR